MVKRHLKRINAPRTWSLARKERTFTIRPHPGAQPLAATLPLSLFLNMVGASASMRSTKYVLNHQDVLVNGRRERRPEAAVGLFDVVSFPLTKSTFRLTINTRDTLVAIPVTGKDATTIPSKILSKTVLSGGKLQVGCHNGRTLLTTETYAVGDTLLLGLDNNVLGHEPLAPGATVFLTGGKHVGTTGVLVGIQDGKATVTVSGAQNAAGGTVETAQRHVFVLGKEKAAVKVAAE